MVDLDGLYVDGTFGRGGHSAELLQRLSGNAHVIGLDKDPEAINFGRSKFKNEKRLELLHESFSNLTNILQVRGKLVMFLVCCSTLESHHPSSIRPSGDLVS